MRTNARQSVLWGYQQTSGARIAAPMSLDLYESPAHTRQSMCQFQDRCLEQFGWCPRVLPLFNDTFVIPLIQKTIGENFENKIILEPSYFNAQSTISMFQIYGVYSDWTNRHMTVCSFRILQNYIASIVLNYIITQIAVKHLTSVVSKYNMLVSQYYWDIHQ